MASARHSSKTPTHSTISPTHVHLDTASRLVPIFDDQETASPNHGQATSPVSGNHEDTSHESTIDRVRAGVLIAINCCFRNTNAIADIIEEGFTQVLGWSATSSTNATTVQDFWDALPARGTSNPVAVTMHQ